MAVQELRCAFCGDTTLWPEENAVHMLVYGVEHLVDNCPTATEDARLMAIEASVQMRVKGDIDG
jgi:hypothetical protein